MEITRTVENLSFAADSHGAELHSIKLDGEEYLWQCGSAWKRYAPMLFPFICSPNDSKYFAFGRQYFMPSNHGFARDSEFELVGESETAVEFELCSDEKTRAVYPYDFSLRVSYEIKDGGIEVKNTVENLGLTAMYFYLGGHPAFMCDINEGKSYVEYEKDERITQTIDGRELVVLDGERWLLLTRERFKNDVIMKDHPNSRAVTLVKSDGGYVRLEFDDSDCIAVWTALDDEAQFICLEPWTSVPVYADDEYPNLEDKPHAIKLEAKESYTYKYFIKVGRQ